jgi:hypothetical protein
LRHGPELDDSERAGEVAAAGVPTQDPDSFRAGPRLLLSIPDRPDYPRGVKYTTWTDLVFQALARTGDNSYGGVGLPTVAAALGFDGLTWNDFAKHEGMPRALMTSMDDLARLGLAKSENVDYGNELTPRGRDIVDFGLASIWPELAKVHLSAQANSFLAKLYEASTLEEETWADLQLVDTDEAARLVGLRGGEGSDLIGRMTFLGDLEQKGLLEAGPRFGGGPLVDRPTYVTAVLLTETAEGDLSRVPGSVDTSASTQKLELKPGAPRPRGRPKGSRYIADRQEVVDAYRKARLLQRRNPSAIPSQEVVARQLHVSRSALAEFLTAEGIPWPPE